MDKKIIFLIDDEPVNIRVLLETFSPDYTVHAAISAKDALHHLKTQQLPDIILLDVVMPEVDGYTLMEMLQQNAIFKQIPVIFITALNEDLDEAKGFELGAVDYITKPIRPHVVKARVTAQLELKAMRDQLKGQNDWLIQEVERRMQENALIQNVTIRALAHLAEIRDLETGEHILRTQAYVRLMARLLKAHPRFNAVINEHYIDLLARSAPLHDIGKVGIPDSILLKADALNEEEWLVMKTHAELGANAIQLAEEDANRTIEFLSLAKEIARWHHEKWDGSGYPDGLSGEDIPVSARLMALADVFDALISKRVYKAAMPYEQAKEIIRELRASHFDPDVTDTFLENFDQFVDIAEKYNGDKP